MEAPLIANRDEYMSFKSSDRYKQRIMVTCVAVSLTLPCLKAWPSVNTPASIKVTGCKNSKSGKVPVDASTIEEAIEVMK